MLSPALKHVFKSVIRKLCEDDFEVSLPSDVPRAEWRAIRRWKDDVQEYERLEILGDSVLRAALCSKLYDDKKFDCGIIAVRS